MKSILFSAAFIGLATAAGLPLLSHHRAGPKISTADTLTSGVREWDKEEPSVSRHGEIRRVLLGSTHDLSLLDIRAITLYSGTPAPTDTANDADELLILKDGELTITAGTTTKQLGPGGVALLTAGQASSFAIRGNTAVTYYLFSFRSRSPEDRSRAQQPFLLDWPEMTMQRTPKGESRQIFSQPVAWLSKIDMHATTLNPGEVSHPPHIHRSEEIILMRSGHVQEYIDGKHYPAAAGDLIFLASGSLHAVENTGTERCEYFALQWQE
jgi:(S)-ureidoglycine aminohydrolase